jgi:serpin B
LPYKGGRFAALVVMPTSGSLSSFTASLTGAKLDSIASSLTTGSAVKLPRFSTTTTTDLVPVLKSLGVRTALSDSADFSGLSPTPLALGDAIQRVYLKVGEKGTEAAAVTGLGMIATSGRIASGDIRFDNPFLFLIRDTTTGAILFASKVVDPSSS